MRLLCLNTSKDVQVGDKLRCLTGILTGYFIKVSKIVEPSVLHRLGVVEFTINGAAQGNGPQQFPPRVLDCIWVGDDSIVVSATFNNEHSLSHVVQEAVGKLYINRRTVRTILVGEREWDQMRDLVVMVSTPPSGIAPEPSFHGVRVMRLPHRDAYLAFEHAPEDPASADRLTCYECNEACHYLFDDGRCRGCTRMTPEEVTGVEHQ